MDASAAGAPDSPERVGLRAAMRNALENVGAAAMQAVGFSAGTAMPDAAGAGGPSAADVQRITAEIQRGASMSPGAAAAVGIPDMRAEVVPGMWLARSDQQQCWCLECSPLEALVCTATCTNEHIGLIP